MGSMGSMGIMGDMRIKMTSEQQVSGRASLLFTCWNKGRRGL